MKKLIIALTVLSSTLAANAQTRLGLEAGLNSSNTLIKHGTTKLDSKSLLGFNVGVNAEIRIINNLYFQPGVHFESKGYKYNTAVGTTTTDSKANPTYVSIPMNLAYKIKAGSGKLFVLAGPYVGYGVAGKISNDVTVAGKTTTTSNAIKFGNDIAVDNMKALDFGINAGLGYEYKNFFIKAQYALGLADLSRDSANKYNNKALTLSLGYWFGSSKKK